MEDELKRLELRMPTREHVKWRFASLAPALRHDVTFLELP
jgi:hypothetical protein